MKKYLNIDEIKILVKEKETLENMESLSPLHEQILEKISFTLFSGCKHIPIFDEIDIDIDRSMPICYCENCYLTFNTSFILSYLQKQIDFNSIISMQIGNNVFKINSITTNNDRIIFDIYFEKHLKSHKFSFSPIELINCNISNNCIIINN